MTQERCPLCNNLMAVPEGSAGARLRCPNCLGEFTQPVLSAATRSKTVPAIFAGVGLLLVVGVVLAYSLNLFPREHSAANGSPSESASPTPSRLLPLQAGPVHALHRPNEFEGLALYLPLDEGEGKRVKDAISGKTFPCQRCTWIEGVSGKALLFTAPGSMVNLDDCSALSIRSGQPFTLALWGRPESNAGVLLCCRPEATGGEALLAVRHKGGRWELVFQPDDAAGMEFRADLNPEPGDWHHVALVRDPEGELSVFSNGKLVRSPMNKPLPQRFLSSFRRLGQDERQFERYRGRADFAYTGALDEVALWHRALRDDEIEKLAARQE